MKFTFTKSPSKLYDQLSAAYLAVETEDATKEQWEIFSGQLNRAIRKILPRSRKGRQRVLRLLFALWSDMNRYIQRNPLNIVGATQDLIRIQDAKKRLEGAINELSK